MKKFFYSIICLFIGEFILLGCSDAETISVSSESYIELDEDSMNPMMDANGGYLTLTFTASDLWSASISATSQEIDWLTLSSTQGEAGVVTLQVSVQSNDTYDERNAVILLVCGNDKKTIVVTQKQKNALLISSNEVDMDATGGVFNVELQSNVNVSYEIDEQAQGWLTAVTSAARGLTSSTFDFQVSENQDMNSRQAVITFRGNDLMEQVIVTQAGSKPAILLSQKEYTVPSNGGSIQVELKSNTPYRVMMPDVPWITEESARSFSTYTHYFTVAANETYDARTADILFVNEADGMQEKITVTQEQKDVILVDHDEYTVDAKGDMIYIEVQANVAYSIALSDEWIQQIATRGWGNELLCFSISANESGNSRCGYITLQSGNIIKNITVNQLGNGSADGEIDDMPIHPW